MNNKKNNKYVKHREGHSLFVTYIATLRNFTRHFLPTSLLAFLLFIFGTGVSQATAVQLTVEAHRNSVVQSRPDFSYFSFFDLPVVNKSGQIAFMASFFNKNQGGLPSSALWTKTEGGQLTPLVEDGMEATSVSATTYFDNHSAYNIAPLAPGRPSSTWINDYGEIAFSYYLEDTTNPGNTFSSAWVAGPGGNLHPVVYAGMPRPDSGTFTGINYDFVSMGYIARLLMNANGQVAFIPTFNEIWQETPACDSTSDALDKLVVQNTENADMEYFLADDGTVLIFDPDNDAILSSTKNQSQALVSKGQTLPGMATGETLSSILATTFNKKGSFAFLARSSSNLFLYVYESGGGIRVVKKDPSKAYTPLYLLDDNRVVYGANQELGIGNPRWGDIWIENTLIAKQGDLAPGSSTGEKLNSIYVVGANNQGQVVFKTIFTVGGSEGVYAWDGSGGIVKVIQTGDKVEVEPGVEREVFKTVFNTAYKQNSQTVINDLGKIVFVVNFNNSTSAIVSAQLGLGTGMANGICPANTLTAANYASSESALGAVNTFTGELVLKQGADLNLGGGPLPLYFTRYYASSLSLDSNNALGNNWRHNYEITLNKRRNTAQIVTGDGRIVSFKRTSISGNSWELARPLDKPYQLVEKNTEAIFVDQSSNIRYAFNTQQCGPRRLSRIQDNNNNTLTLNYDADNMLSSVSDSLGRNLDFAYDADNHLTKVSDQVRQVLFNYDADNNLASYTDAKNKVTSYGYDTTRTSCGLLSEVTLPDGKTPNKVEYNQDGRVSKFADSDGNAYTFDYSENATTVTSPVDGGGKTYSQVYGHNNEGKLVAYTDEDKKTIKYTYDSRGKLETVTDRLPTPGVTTYAYDDASGKVVSITKPDNTVIKYEYKNIQDADGINIYGIARITYPDTTTDQFDYDLAGNIISYTDQAGKVWPYAVNSNGQLVKFSNPNNAEIVFAYNADGTLSSVMDDKLNTTLYSYDGLKRHQSTLFQDMTERRYEYDNRDALISTTNENLDTTTLAYDDNGNLQTVTDRLLKQRTFGFDSQNRLNKVTDSTGNFYEIKYDEQSRMEDLIDPVNDKITLDYDAFGRLNKVTDPRDKVWTKTYDAEGVVTSATDPVGKKLSFSPDNLGRIKTITDNLGNTFNLTYDSMSRITAFKNQNGNTSKITYDSRGLASRVETPSGIAIEYERNALGLVTKVIDPNGNEWTKEYDQLGRLIATYDPGGEKEEYSYDNRNRLSHVVYPDTGTLDITYDGTGNITELLFEDKPTTPPIVTATLQSAVNGANAQQVKLTYYYDRKGRLIGGGNHLALAWDADFNRIVESNGIKIGYLPDGNIGTITYTDGSVVTYVYEHKVLKKVIDWDGNETVFTYRDDGRLASIIRPNHTRTEYKTYESTSDPEYTKRHNAGEVPRLENGTAVETIDEFHTVDGVELGISDTTRYAVLVGKDKRIVQVMSDGFQRTAYDQAKEESLDIQYYNGRQMKGSVLDAFEYEGGKLKYDGERRYQWKAKKISTIEHLRGLRYQDVPKDDINYEDITYDALGHRISRTTYDYVLRPFDIDRGEDVTTYTWNYGLGRPVVAETHYDKYTYPDDSTRLSASEDWKYVYLPGGQLLFAARNSDNRKYFYHFDYKGNTTFLSDMDSVAVEAYDYTSDGSRISKRSLIDDVIYNNPFTYRGFFGWMSDVGEQYDGALQPRLYSTGTGYFNAKYHRYVEYTNWHNYDLAAAPEIHYLEEPLMAGAIMAGTGFLMIVIPEPTTSVAGTFMVLSALDMMFAGAHTVVSGKEKTTLFTKALRVIPDELGVDPATTDTALTVGGLVLAGLGGAGMSSSAASGSLLSGTRTTFRPTAPEPAAPQDALVGRRGTAVTELYADTTTLHPMTIKALRAKYANIIWALEKGGVVEAPSGGFNIPGGLQDTYGVGLRQIMADITAATGKEVGLFRTGGRGGSRLLVLGEETSVQHPSGTWRMIAHTHPNGTMWFSGEQGDMGFLRFMFNRVRRPGINGEFTNHGYRSVLITPGGETVIPRFGLIWEVNEINASLVKK